MPDGGAKENEQNKPMTKERLSNYLGIQLRVNNREERLERMKSNEQFPAAKESDGSKHVVTGYDRMGNAITKRLEYWEKIKDDMAADKAELDAVEQAVKALRDPLEQEVLRLRYLVGDCNRPMKWRNVALIMYHDDTEADELRVKRLGQKAIDHIENGEGV